MAHIPRCLTVAGSDSGGGAGLQADLKAFAAEHCWGTTAVVAVTAQNTREVTAIHEVPVQVVRAQIAAVADDIGVDAAKTGMLFSSAVVEVVASELGRLRPTLVVDPVMIASSGARLLRDDAVAALVTLLFPLATVVTPNHLEAEALTGRQGASKRDLAEALVGLGAPAALVTGGHGAPIDHLFDGRNHHELPVARHERASTHGAGCTHSATLTARLAHGDPLLVAAARAAEVASSAVARGVVGLGGGDGAVDVLGFDAHLEASA